MEMKVDFKSSAAKVNVSNSKKNAGKTNDIMNLTGSNNKTVSKPKEKEEFKDVLNSKSGIKDDNNMQNHKCESDKVQDEAVNIEEIEEKIEDSSKEEVIDILNTLVSMLAEMDNNSEQLNLDADTINNDIVKMIIDKLNNLNSEDKASANVSDNSLQNLLDKLTEILDDNGVLEKLNKESCSVLEGILQKLQKSLEEKDNSNTINNIIDNLQKQSEKNNGDKALSLEELLNRNTSKENYSENSSDEKSQLSKHENSTSNKDDEILNKLLKDNNTDNRINMFSFRTALAQGNQNVTQVNSITDVNKASLAKDLIQDVKYMQTNSLKELTVKVNPGNLGQITIKLSSEDGIMKATLKANSKETVELMVQNVAEIKKAMDNQNIKIADVNIELYHDDTTFFKEGSFKEQMNEKQEHGINNNNVNSVNEENEDVEEENSDDQSNVNFLA